MDSTDDLAVLVAADYAVFGVMLALSAAIGFYFAYEDRKKKQDMQGYLLAEKQMGFLPVALSLSLSFVSGVTVLGVPAEIHYYGSMYIWLMTTFVWVTPIVAEVYIPLFYRLGVGSAFEYIEMRYNRMLRLLCTFIYILQNIMYIGIMIYAPALALSSVTNFSMWAAVLSVGLVCTLYTTLGGLKAVIWTDVFQGLVLIAVAFVVIFVSADRVGGFDSVWEACREGGRIDFIHFETDPRIRNTFWSLCVGLGFLWLSVFGTSQSQVQRYLACRTESDAKKGMYLGAFLCLACLALMIVVGFISYAYFGDCDPLVSGKISAPDQLLPYMVLLIFRDQPGLPGLFMAGVFAGCLSTVSSGINAMACVTVKDFIQPFVKKSPSFMAWTSKGMVFLYGGLCIGFAFLASALGGILQASLSVLGLIGGPLLAVFSLGVTFPCANTKGATTGLLLGVGLTLWIFIGSTTYPPGPEFTRPKPVTISGCPIKNSSVINSTTVPTVTQLFDSTTEVIPTDPSTPAERPPIADLYAVSYAYYAAIGFGATLIAGLIASLLTCGHRDRERIDPALIVPMFDHKLLRWLPSKFREWMRCGVRHDKRYEDEDVDLPEKESPSKNGVTKEERGLATITGGTFTPEDRVPSYHEDNESPVRFASSPETSFSQSSNTTVYDERDASGKVNPTFVADEDVTAL